MRSIVAPTGPAAGLRDIANALTLARRITQEMKLLSPAIKVATVFTMGGASSAVANLLLARHLTKLEYGEFSLVLAIATFSLILGPVSLDEMVLRDRPGPHGSLLRDSATTGLIAAALIVVLTWSVYSIDPLFLPFIAMTIAAASVARVGASVYQSEQRFKWSLWLVQSQNLTLILAAVASGIFFSVTATTIFSVYAWHWLVAAIVAWIGLRHFSGISVKEEWKVSWRERTPLFGTMIAFQLFASADRLLIPKLLDIESLATFGVLMVLVISPFKMFELSVSYTLIPGLRNAASIRERDAILRHEGKTAAAVTGLAIASGFVVAPWAKHLILGDKYELSTWLIAAAVISGTVKIAAVFLSSIVTALGEERRLNQLTIGAWGSLAMAVLGAWLGSFWGLPGLVIGFASGNLVRIAAAAIIAKRVL